MFEKPKTTVWTECWLLSPNSADFRNPSWYCGTQPTQQGRDLLIGRTTEGRPKARVLLLNFVVVVCVVAVIAAVAVAGTRCLFSVSPPC